MKRETQIISQKHHILNHIQYNKLHKRTTTIFNDV